MQHSSNVFNEKNLGINTLSSLYISCKKKCAPSHTRKDLHVVSVEVYLVPLTSSTNISFPIALNRKKCTLMLKTTLMTLTSCWIRTEKLFKPMRFRAEQIGKKGSVDYGKRRALIVNRPFMGYQCDVDINLHVTIFLFLAFNELFYRSVHNIWLENRLCSVYA